MRKIAVYDETSDTTTVINHIIYDSFGNITSETDPSTGLAPTEASILAGDFLFGFTGREFDAETPDLMYYRARYYITALGSWISNDPIGFAALRAKQHRFREPTSRHSRHVVIWIR